MKQNLKFKAFPEFVGKPMTELYEHLKENYRGLLAKEEDLTEENIPKDNNWYYAFGSLRIQGGHSNVPLVFWLGFKLYRNANWFKNDWNSNDRVVLLETANIEISNIKDKKIIEMCKDGKMHIEEIIGLAISRGYEKGQKDAMELFKKAINEYETKLKEK